MDRQHRHDLKHDKFVDEIGALSARARANQRILLTIGASAVVIALVAYGIYFYRANRETQAQKALALAIETIEAPVGEGEPAQGQPAPKFKTAAERDQAAEKLFRKLEADYSGSDAGDVAGLYLARIAAGRGDVKTARTLLEEFVASQGSNLLANTARFSLLQLRIQHGEAAQVMAEINAELAKAEPVLPTDSLLLLLGEAYEEQGNVEKSRETYRRIATEFPESAFASEAQRRIGQA